MRPAVNARFGQRRSDKIARWPNRARTAGAGEAIACAGEAQKPAPDVKGEPHVERARSLLISPTFTKRLRLLPIYHGFHQ